MSTVRIEVKLDSSGAVQGVKQLGSEIDRLPQAAIRATGGMKEFGGASERSRREMMEAERAAELLGSQIGMHLPRAVSRFMGESKALGSVLTGVFNFSIYLAAGSALIGLVGNIGEKMGWWGKQSEEAKKRQEELNKSVDESIKQLDEYNDKIDKMQRARGLIGLEGSAKGRAGLLQLQKDLLVAEASYYQQQGVFNRASFEIDSANSRPNSEAATKVANKYFTPLEGDPDKKTLWNQIEEQEIQAEQKYISAKEALASAKLQLEYDETQEAKKQQDERLKNLKSYLAETLKLEIAGISSPASKLGAQFRSDWASAGIAASGVGSAEIAARRKALQVNAVQGLLNLGKENFKTQHSQDADASSLSAESMKEYFDELSKGYDKEKKGLNDAIDLMSKNRAIQIDLMKQKKDYIGVMGLEMQTLDEMEIEYEGNAEAIAALEQRKRLLVLQTNQDIAKDSEEKFNRTASAIEGMFNRAFSNVKSFSDFWKQAWSQMANYAVSSIAKQVAAWWTGQKSMAQAAKTGGGYFGGGGSGGMQQGVQSVLSFAGAAPMMAGSSLTGTGAGGYSPMQVLSGYDTVLGSTGTGAIGIGAGLSKFAKSPAAGFMGAMLGYQLAGYGVGQGNLMMGGLGGALTGAGLGYGISGLLSTSMSASVGSALGISASIAFPVIGALAGLGIGIYMASRKRGQQKNQSARLVEAYNAAQKKIVDAYLGHKETYDQATGALDSIYQNSVSSLSGMGTPGQRSIDAITRGYEDTAQYLQSIELRREGRISTMSGLPIPEFASGSNGIIRAGSGGFLSVLHPNEAVLNERAAATLGDSKIKALNSGQGGGGQNLNIQMVFPGVSNPRGFEQTLKSNRGALINIIRQSAHDVGLPYPV
jgi:hypothetical protein